MLEPDVADDAWFSLAAISPGDPGRNLGNALENETPDVGIVCADRAEDVAFVGDDVDGVAGRHFPDRDDAF